MLLVLWDCQDKSEEITYIYREREILAAWQLHYIDDQEYNRGNIHRVCVYGILDRALS